MRSGATPPAALTHENCRRFDYRLECYLPKPKRQFGYFSLPILYRDAMVGQVDCKAHREHRELELIQLHLADTAPMTEAFATAFATSAWQFAAFNGCDAITVTDVQPRRHEAALLRAIRQTC